jgi:hypothetical protein
MMVALQSGIPEQTKKRTCYKVQECHGWHDDTKPRIDRATAGVNSKQEDLRVLCLEASYLVQAVIELAGVQQEPE